MILQLASQSPRRRELLEQIGVSYTVVPISIDEQAYQDEKPETYVVRIACEKAKAGYLASPQHVTLGADTCVVIDDVLLGKPKSFEDAQHMLQRLSGRKHDVYTAVALCRGQEIEHKLRHTEVTFKPITLDDIERYWLTGEPCDKAGAYGIQGKAAVFIEAIHGSYSAVMGLPLAETAELCVNFGIPFWSSTRHE